VSSGAAHDDGPIGILGDGLLRHSIPDGLVVDAHEDVGGERKRSRGVDAAEQSEVGGGQVPTEHDGKLKRVGRSVRQVRGDIHGALRVAEDACKWPALLYSAVEEIVGLRVNRQAGRRAAILAARWIRHPQPA